MTIINADPNFFGTFIFFSKKFRNGLANTEIIQPTTNGHKKPITLGPRKIIATKKSPAHKNSKINSKQTSHRLILLTPVLLIILSL